MIPSSLFKAAETVNTNLGARTHRHLFVTNRLTVSVTGGGDNVWEQRKLEARKMLENAAESPPSSARIVGRGVPDALLIVENKPTPLWT